MREKVTDLASYYELQHKGVTVTHDEGDGHCPGAPGTEALVTSDHATGARTAHEPHARHDVQHLARAGVQLTNALWVVGAGELLFGLWNIVVGRR